MVYWYSFDQRKKHVLTLIVTLSGSNSKALSVFISKMSVVTTILPAAYGLPLKNAKLLLSNDYLPLEAGVALTEDGMHHIAASTYMKWSTGAMIDWWFGWIHTTDQYKLWHPRDHVFSD